MSKILDGKQLADKINQNLKDQIKNLKSQTNIAPKLVTILIGENPASRVYINIKHRNCDKVGILSESIELSENTTKNKIKEIICTLNEDPSVHGILLQLPLPNKLQDFESEILQYIDPDKDVDGFNYINRGKLFDYKEELAPCTAKGIITLLEYYNIKIEGKDITIINRSNLVGKPLIFMLLKRNGTISICHSKTKEIGRYIKEADILIVAVGHPNFITQDKIKEGVIIIDVGTNRVNGRLCGDVDFNGVFDKVNAITPSPGGVGPLTVSSLLQNTLIAYKKQLDLD